MSKCDDCHYYMRPTRIGWERLKEPFFCEEKGGLRISHAGCSEFAWHQEITLQSELAELKRENELNKATIKTAGETCDKLRTEVDKYKNKWMESNWHLESKQGEMNELRAENERLNEQLYIFRNYLQRNAYGLILHDIEKEITEAKKEND